jgi:hypothetical protein
MKSTVWFNNKGRHALPSFYNALSNTVLRATLSEAGVTDPENFGNELDFILTNTEYNDKLKHKVIFF